MATPTPYTALCGKKCTGSDSVEWTKSLDTGKCYKATTVTSIAMTAVSTQCSASPGTSYISGAKLAGVSSELENAGDNMIRLSELQY